MRTSLIGLFGLLAIVAGCGDGSTNGASDLSAPLDGAPLDAAHANDLSVPADLAVAPDLVTVADLTVRPDLVKAPDLAGGGSGAVCGGFIGKPCPNAGEFCDFPLNCGVADQNGTCVVKPQICNKIYDPVCGCDMVQYGNDCERQKAGASLRDHGICGCQKQCGQGNYCAQCKNGPACLPNGAVC